MSLLNDALRKKRQEQQMPGMPPNAPAPLPAARPGRKRIWSAVAVIVLVSAAVYGGWVCRSVTGADANPPLKSLSARVAPHRQPAESPEPRSMSLRAVMPQDHGPVSGRTVATEINPDAPMQTPPQPPAASQPKPFKPKAPKESLKKDVRPADGNHTGRPKTAPVSPMVPETPAQGKAAPQDSGQTEALYQRAQRLHRRNQIEPAIALYQEVIKRDPDHGNALFNLGAAYLQIESYAKAYDIMDGLYRKSPDNGQVKLNLAIARIGCGQFRQALDLLDHMAARPPGPLFEIAFHKAVAFSHLDRPRDAMQWYKRAEALRPDDPRLLFNLAVVNDQQQHYADAIHYYGKYIEHNPDIDALKEKQIQHRIRTLREFNAKQNLKESASQ